MVIYEDQEWFVHTFNVGEEKALTKDKHGYWNNEEESIDYDIGLKFSNKEGLDTFMDFWMVFQFDSNKKRIVCNRYITSEFFCDGCTDVFPFLSDDMPDFVDKKIVKTVRKIVKDNCLRK